MAYLQYSLVNLHHLCLLLFTQYSFVSTKDIYLPTAHGLQHSNISLDWTITKNGCQEKGEIEIERDKGTGIKETIIRKLLCQDFYERFSNTGGMYNETEPGFSRFYVMAEDAKPPTKLSLIVNELQIDDAKNYTLITWGSKAFYIMRLIVFKAEDLTMTAQIDGELISPNKTLSFLNETDVKLLNIKIGEKAPNDTEIIINYEGDSGIEFVKKEPCSRRCIVQLTPRHKSTSLVYIDYLVQGAEPELIVTISQPVMAPDTFPESAIIVGAVVGGLALVIFIFIVCILKHTKKCCWEEKKNPEDPYPLEPLAWKTVVEETKDILAETPTGLMEIPEDDEILQKKQLIQDRIDRDVDPKKKKVPTATLR